MGSIADQLTPLICSENEQHTLITLASGAIRAAIQERPMPEPSAAQLTATLLVEAATFVTLSLQGKLRGCVGNLVAQEAVYRSVMRNAMGAALRDSRFEPVASEEFSQLGIYISILSPLMPLQFDSPNQLLHQLTPGQDGVVLKHWGRTATFLPHVWTTFQEKEEFLKALCRKAELEMDAWRKPNVEILVYRVSEFGDALVG